MPDSAPITSRINPRVKQLRAAFNGNVRLAPGLIAVEGATLLQEAIRSGLAPRTVFASAHYELPGWLPRDSEVVRLSEAVFASATDTETPQGLAALLTQPSFTLEAVLNRDGPTLLLVAAGLQDPGNLGTLVRTAEAFGATAVLTTPGTVSAWNPKAVRASAGSVFRTPVIAVTLWQLEALRGRGIRLLAAVTGDSAPHHSSAVPLVQLDLSAPCALLIGNEGSGLTAAMLALADTRITIPTPGPVESLNAAVAGSVLLYEASRQRLAAQRGEDRAAPHSKPKQAASHHTAR